MRWGSDRSCRYAEPSTRLEVKPEDRTMPDSPLTIGQVARQAGLATSAIRYYESIGLLPEPERLSGQRRYAPDVLRRLGAIDVAKQAGFTLEETRALLGADA